MLITGSVFLSLSGNTQTPVAYYPFNGNANDAIGTLHGTVTGATLTTDFLGNPSSAYYFNGASDINLSASSVIRPTAQLTVSAWFTLENTAGANQARAIVSCAEVGGYNLAYNKPTNELWVNLRRNGGWATIGTNADPYKTGWHYIALTYDGRYTRFYLDGVLINTNDAGGTFAIQYNSNVNTYIGAEAANGFVTDPTRYGQGNIDEVKFYSTALTTPQIQQEYFAGNSAQKPGSGNAISFDGVNDLVQINHAASTVFTNNYTLECWIRPAVFTSFGGLISKFHTAGSNGFNLKLLSTGNFRGLSFDDMVTADNLLTANTWYHIAAVNDNGIRRLYINGMEIPLTGTAMTFNTSNTDPIITGKDYTASGGRYFNGQIDEVRIWNTPLTQAQIRDRVCKKIIPADALYGNLVVYNNFDEVSGNTAYDGTANANTGVLTNGPVRVTSGAHIGNSSAHSYAGAASSISLTHPTRGDALTATLTAGGADAVQVYCVTQYPNTGNGISAIPGNNGYFGVFPVNGTGTQYTAVYDYTGITGIINETYLRLYKRNDNAATLWTNSGATINTSANTLTVTGQTTEYMVGEIPAPKLVMTGALTGDFNTLKQAFDALNAGGGNGTVTLTIVDNTTETATAVLNQTLYNVNIIPDGNRVVEGNIAGPLVRLNSADNVTINGQTLNGVHTLTFRNTNTGTAACTIQLLNSASDNIIRKCIIEGSSSGTAVSSGIIVINTTNAEGSLNNIIDSNHIRRSSAGGAVAGIILSRDLSATGAISNTQITNNSIENVFLDNITSWGIVVQTNCINTLISGNSIYNSLTYSNNVNGVSYYPILVNTINSAIGSGVIIDSNYIGGSSPLCAGSYMNINSPNHRLVLQPIGVEDNSNANPTSVTRNVIRNIFIDHGNPLTTNSNPFRGIDIESANLASLHSNSIGSADIFDDEILIHTRNINTGPITIFGYLIKTGCSTPVHDNFIGGINVVNVIGGTAPTGLVLMDFRNGISSINIKKNTIGSPQPNNIFVDGHPSQVSGVQGIILSDPATVSAINLDSNIVRNIGGTDVSLTGINLFNSNAAATSTTVTMNGNTISNFDVIGTNGNNIGIYFLSSSTVTSLASMLSINGNSINNISTTGNSTFVRGIRVANSSTSVNRLKGSISNNSLSNLTSTSAASTANTRGISVANDIELNDSLVIAGNTITGISDAGTAVTLNDFGNSNGIHFSAINSGTNGAVIVRDNSISGIGATSTANALTRSHAIALNTNNAVVERNRIFNVYNNSTSNSARLEPILLRSRNDDAATSMVRNNMIAINPTGVTAQIAGIRLGDGTVTSQIYHNSLLNEGTSSSNSYGIYKDATAMADIKNNIIYNAVTGTGTAFAVGLETNTSGYTGNNNYFVSPASSTLAQEGSNSHTLASWQAATSQDASSKEGQSGGNTNAANLFTNRSIAELFVNTANPGESIRPSDSGTPLASVLNDYLGTSRSASTPDIGAHEFVHTGPLPLNLISFSGNKQNSNARLEWRTVNEVNVSYYEVQRAVPGGDFAGIGNVTAGSHTYMYTDLNVFNSLVTALYRLKMVDFDGRFTYSNTIRLSHQSPAITIFPNPVKDMMTIAGLKGKGTVLLFDESGRMLFSQETTAQSLVISIGNYPKGIYLLQYRYEGQSSVHKIVKQ